MNLIVINSPQMPTQTDIKLIFDAFEGRQREFNWLITEHECYSFTTDIDIFNKKIIFLSGDELTDIVINNNIQFVWGILSAFDKAIDIDINNLSVIPTFDGEWRYGTENVQPQHPLAVAEIVCVDSSYTLFLSKDDDLSNRFHRHFSDAQDLYQWHKNLKNKEANIGEKMDRFESAVFKKELFEIIEEFSYYPH
jgi:hypothetical protein